MLYKAETQVNFIDDMVLRSADTNFPPYLLSLFKKHFGFDNGAFFDAAWQIGDENRGNRPKKEVMVSVCGGNASRITKIYNEYFFAMDHMSAAKLPGDRPALVLVQNSLEEFHSREYARYFDQRSLHHFLCLYLHDSSGQYLGRLAFLRYKDEDAFAEEEMDCLSSLAKHISYQYETYLRDYRTSKRMGMLELSLHSLPTGVVMLDDRLRVVYQNEAAEAYCHELASRNCAQGSPHLSEVATVVNRALSGGESTPGMAESLSDLQFGGYRFHLSSCIMREIDNSRIPYHILYLSPDGAGKRPEQSEQEDQVRRFARDYRLTARETDLLRCIVSCKKNAEISQALCVSPHTVKAHINSIYRKAGVTNRTSLFRKLYEQS